MDADQVDRLSRALAGRYTLQRELGRGGMATVWLARDLPHDRLVALKVLRPDLAALLGPERFLREISLTARLDHPHILPLLDSGEARGPDGAGSYLFYTMPYVEGESLRDCLTREKQLPLEDALQITRQVAEALDYAHGHQVVHRDIKPENILLAAGHARVADFGIARAVTTAGGEKLTETGLAVGTPAYMSPEQAAGEQAVDGRSDLYSLGCVLYEMLVGEPPYTGPTPQAILARKLHEPLPHVSVVREAVPPALEAVIGKALARVPADRYASASQLRDALGSYAGDVLPAAPAAPAPATRSWWRAGVLTAAGLAIAGLVAVQRWWPPIPRYSRTAIAVLPFQNLTTDSTRAYVAGGLHEEVLTQLSKVGALTVISRRSVMGYATGAMPLAQLAEELGVGSVVEGSVQLDGDRLRVHVQLIDPLSGVQLWAERYDRSPDDAFAVQSDIARRIVAAVGASLGEAEDAAIAKPPTANAEAYALFLQGQDYERRPGYLPQNLVIAQGHYEEAIRQDSTFALARASLSHILGRLYWFGHDTRPLVLERQRREAETALRLAPDLPDAHWAMGLVHYFAERDYRRALAELNVALEGRPGSANFLAYAGYLHRRLGQWREAESALAKALQLDPRDADLWRNFAQMLQYLRRYPEALAASHRALALSPDYREMHEIIGEIYLAWDGQLDTLWGAATDWDRVEILLWKRQPDSALAFLSRLKDPVYASQSRYHPRSLFAAWAYQLKGNHSRARSAFDSALVVLDSVLIQGPDDWRSHAARGLALAGLGLRDAALREARWLREAPIYRDQYQGSHAVAARAQMLALSGETDAALLEVEKLLVGPSWKEGFVVHLDPRYNPVRSDPRFQALLVKYRNRPPIR